LTAAAPWDPSAATESLETTVTVPLGYSTTLGELDLMSLNLTLTDLGEMGELVPTSDKEITQAFSYLSQAQPCMANIHYKHTKHKPMDFADYQPFLGWKPVEVIKKTFEATTQWATSTFTAPMKQHYKSRFPFFNRPRIREMFCTDTWFGTTLALGGFTCAQLYYGVKSKYMVLYPMTSESQGPQTLEDLCRDHGAPIKLKNDRAQMEVGKAWTAICRKYQIAQCTTEAHHPWQNEAERYIQEIKRCVNIIMDQTGCPNYLWVMCSLYVVYLLNHLANESLNWRTPIEACFGTTPDISALIMFAFFEKVYYLDAESPFPESKRNQDVLLVLQKI
jgi:hypothetical protein